MAEESPQFIGEYEDVPVDPKGRLIVPSAFRRTLPMGVSTFVVARWFEGCLAVYDPNGWKRVMRQLQGMDGGQRQSRQLIRALAGRATEVRIDRQGRILIPRKYLNMVDVTDRATIIGAVNRFEVWNPERCAGYLSEADQKLEEIVEAFDLL
jgi:MraZ protein